MNPGHGPDDVEKITNSINANLEDGSSPTLEYRVVHKDGSIHHVIADGKTKFDEAGKPIKSIGTVQDITERKQAEEARQVSELRFRAISENSLAGISENIRRRMAGEVQSLRYEFRGLCKDGEIKYIEVLGARVDLEGQAGHHREYRGHHRAQTGRSTATG
ncbi:MAG: PAS domain-containing protein [Anaerolineales bacterium]|nr:PAS domain-containing protein [Anaerolineales bacterium]